MHRTIFASSQISRGWQRFSAFWYCHRQLSHIPFLVQFGIWGCLPTTRSESAFQPTLSFQIFISTGNSATQALCGHRNKSFVAFVNLPRDFGWKHDLVEIALGPLFSGVVQNCNHSITKLIAIDLTLFNERLRRVQRMRRYWQHVSNRLLIRVYQLRVFVSADAPRDEEQSI